MEETLKIVIPRILGSQNVEFRIIDHGSKQKLLQDLPSRLAGYARRIPREDIRALVVIDRDDDDCKELKAHLEKIAAHATLPTKSSPAADGQFRIVNRIVIEELEAWFFGDVPAICAAYSSVPNTLATKHGFRHSDAITGGTWEKLLLVLQKAGYYTGNKYLPKCEVARKVAAYMDPKRNSSPSFRHFATGLMELLI